MTGATRQRQAHDHVVGNRVGVAIDVALGVGDLGAVPPARRRIIACLRQIASVDCDFDAAEVVVGELLANAVAHTAGPAWVSLRWDGDHPQLRVADLGAASGGPVDQPEWCDRTSRAQLPLDPLADGGRGLFLISRLARDVTVSRRADGGCVICVELDLHRP